MSSSLCPFIMDKSYSLQAASALANIIMFPLSIGILHFRIWPEGPSNSLSDFSRSMVQFISLYSPLPWQISFLRRISKINMWLFCLSWHLWCWMTRVATQLGYLELCNTGLWRQGHLRFQTVLHFITKHLGSSVYCRPSISCNFSSVIMSLYCMLNLSLPVEFFPPVWIACISTSHYDIKCMLYMRRITKYENVSSLEIKQKEIHTARSQEFLFK